MKRYVIGILLILSLSKPLSAGAAYPSYGPNLNMQTRTSSNITATAIDESDLDWLEGFTGITEDELKAKLEAQQVESAAINKTTGHLYLIASEGDELYYYKVENPSYSLKSYLQINSIEIDTLVFEEDQQAEESTLNQWTIIVLMSVLTIFGPLTLFFFVMRRESKKVKVSESASKDQTKAKIPKVKFSDVEGIEELKTDISRLVDCLKHPEKYREIGARPPKGVILYGPSGTGKTLIAKAIAGEAGVPFFSEVGSNFVEMYVGVGAKRVRELYKKARKAAPCIVFIDEIDAVAGQRGQDTNGERDQTLNALLTELDGFDDSKNIITICATNRLDMLDTAFKRAGRFDLKLAVGLPDKKSRKRILEIHGKQKKFMDDVNMDVIATKTSGFSGAELEALLNESALIAVGRQKPAIGNAEIDDAFFKIVMQGNKKKREEVTEMNRIVSWHESGHTLATKLLTDDSVTSVTIIGSASGAGGVTFRTPKEDYQLHSRRYLESSVKIMYAGRAAEELYFKDPEKITTGASQDIKQATAIIKDFLSAYGMGDKGMLDLSQFGTDSKAILEEASGMAKRLYAETVRLLESHYHTLYQLAETLLQEETLDEKQIDGIIAEANQRKETA